VGRVDGCLPLRGIERADPRLKPFVRKVQGIRAQIVRIRRTYFLLERVHPAAHWACLRRVTEDSNPVVDSAAWTLGQGSVAVAPYKHYVRFIFSPRSLKTEDAAWLETFRADLVASVTAVQSEFASRLGSRASATWLLQRYANRCRWLRRRDLVEALRQVKGQRKEIYLTRDVALCLFDQGLDVVTEEARGQQRYDVIGTALLVEGKIQTAKRSALSAAAGGLKQLHQYYTALSNEGVELEPVLVLFRLGGSAADLPSECSIGNLKVSIAYVDLGDSSESGNRSGPPQVITPEMIASRIMSKGRGSMRAPGVVSDTAKRRTRPSPARGSKRRRR